MSLSDAWRTAKETISSYSKLFIAKLSEKSAPEDEAVLVELDPRDFLVYTEKNELKVLWGNADLLGYKTNAPASELSRRWVDQLLNDSAPQSTLCLGMFVTLVASSPKLVAHDSFDAALGVLEQELDSAKGELGLDTGNLLSNSIALVANLRFQRQGHFRTFLSALANSAGLCVPPRGVHQNPLGESTDNKAGDPSSAIFTQMHDWEAPPTLAAEQYIHLLKTLLTCQNCHKPSQKSLEEALEYVDDLAKGLPRADGFVPDDNDDWPQAMYENNIGVCASYTTDSISNFNSEVAGKLKKGSEDYQRLQGFFNESSQKSADNKAELLCCMQPGDNGLFSDYLSPSSQGNWKYAAEAWKALFSLMGRYSALLLQRAAASGTDDKPLWLFGGWDPAHVAVYLRQTPAMVPAEKKRISLVEVRLLDNLPVFYQQGYSFLTGDQKQGFLQNFENRQGLLQALLYLALLANGAEQINTSVNRSPASEPLLDWLSASTSTEKRDDHELFSSAHELAKEFSLASKHGLQRLLLLKTKPRSSLFGRDKGTKKEKLQKRFAKLWSCRKCHKKKPSRP